MIALAEAIVAQEPRAGTLSLLLFAFLAGGHAIAEFLRARPPGPRLYFAALLLAALPVLDVWTIPCLTLATVVRRRIATLRLQLREGTPLAAFAAEHVAQLIALATIAWLWSQLFTWRDAWLWRPRLELAPIALIVGIYAFSVQGGATIVAGVLRRFHFDDLLRDDADGADAPAMGRAIGILERLLIVTLVLVDAWAGLGLILAAKSIARFKDLERRAFGEYYLIGTLTSVLVAVAAGLLARGLTLP